MNRSAALCITLACIFASTARIAVAADASSTTPALDALSRFTAADVPASGPAEVPVPPIKITTKAGFSPAGLPGKGLAQHPMLYIGEGYNKMFVVKDGHILWTYNTGKGGEYDDAWLLSNGNILFSRMGYAEEITPEKKVIWHLDPAKGGEIHSVQPIGLDKVFVMQNGQPPKLMIVNIKTGAVEVDHELVAPGSAGPGGTHLQFRRGRITAAGTYLVSWLALGKVVEYDKDFKEIWSYKTTWPWAAVRLHNGNTLITDEKEKFTREVNPKGETVWEHKLSELPPEIPFTVSQSCARLANGNTVICSMGGRGAGCQMIEVTRDKKVVWALYDWMNLGPCTAVQMLDDPGVPENPGNLQR
jgi:hypothetical protein